MTSQRGASLILFTLVFVLVVLPVLGLALDGALVFWVKAKLSAAVDAAALAAGRNPTASATTTAQQYVYANFPSGWMGSSYSAAPAASVTYPNTGTRQVTVTASVHVPLHLARLFGMQTFLVPATATASRRSSNIMLVLDRSGSMNTTGADGAIVCNTMIASATTFINYFTDGQDQFGLISFHAWANVDFPFTTSFQSSSPNMTTVLSDLACGANTSSAMALNMAYTQIKNLGSAAYASNGALNVIVFFTDGQPNGITAAFPAKGQSDNRYYANPNGTYLSQIDSPMPATTSQCQSSLSSYPGVIIQGSAGASTGLTQGVYQIPSPAPTTTCASGVARAICDTDLTVVNANGCYFNTSPWQRTNPWPITGPDGVRQDVAYLPTTDYYGNSTNNSSFMTVASDWITSGPYANKGFRSDVPSTVEDVSFNAADAQALAIISDTNYKPLIYTIGLGGAADNPDLPTFETFLERVANDPRSNRYNSSLPTGLFVYAPDDTQLASAFHQIASQILRLSK